jgi:CheY-like chemotaxis protein
VDDKRLNRLVLGRMLTKLGFEVVEADNGIAAIEQFIFHQPALSCVLLDLQMPILDGWETAKRLRGLEAVSRWARVPIVACTALSPQEHWHSHRTVADSALSSGCDDLLVRAPLLCECCSIFNSSCRPVCALLSLFGHPCMRVWGVAAL